MNINQIKSLIARGEIKNALALLPNTTEAIQLRSQYSNLEKSEMLGTLSTSDANITRNRIVNAILSFIDMQTQEPPPVTPSFTTNFAAIETAYKNAEWADVISLLDTHFGDNPTAQYSQLKQTIEHYLSQGLMPPPAVLQGLKMLINQLKNR